MRDIIFWTLIVLGPKPYAIETNMTNAECQQAKYDYSRSLSSASKHARPVMLKCRPIYKRRPIP